MTDHVQVRKVTATALRHRVRLGVAALAVAALPLAALSPARAADQAPAGEAPSAAALARETGVASELAAMGLEVRTKVGLILAFGDAGIVNAAVAHFADEDPIALFTGPDETGTGYLLIRGTSIAPWIGFTPGSGVAIQSVSNETDDEVVVYDQATGHLNVAQDHHTAENLPQPHTPSGKANRAGATHSAVALQGPPGVLSGNQTQIPVHIPTDICGNSRGVLSIVYPGYGSTCVNSG
ncbi:Small secreted domain [Streptomyces sp. TLI_053]|uniref:chaplin n=1 Tax=Streptomyces sp. TLI_053 TaxID=1855352 RepID=UPI00087A93CB|nr:chaplin [Streptomyces sp. TLI_053]SDT83474.1 Small secreted domain [Streptomyces sp. TLI_053]